MRKVTQKLDETKRKRENFNVFYFIYFAFNVINVSKFLENVR